MKTMYLCIREDGDSKLMDAADMNADLLRTMSREDCRVFEIAVVGQRMLVFNVDGCTGSRELLETI